MGDTACGGTGERRGLWSFALKGACSYIILLVVCGLPAVLLYLLLHRVLLLPSVLHACCMLIPQHPSSALLGPSCRRPQAPCCCRTSAKASQPRRSWLPGHDRTRPWAPPQRYSSHHVHRQQQWRLQLLVLAWLGCPWGAHQGMGATQLAAGMWPHGNKKGGSSCSSRVRAKPPSFGRLLLCRWRGRRASLRATVLSIVN